MGRHPATDPAMDLATAMVAATARARTATEEPVYHRP
jgi:hypothetical protein